RRIFRPRQPHAELAAPPRALAARLHTAAVQFDQALRERETEPEAGLVRSGARVELPERLEHVLQRRRRNADAVILHANQRIAVVDLEHYLDDSLRRSEFRRVAEQVR